LDTGCSKTYEFTWQTGSTTGGYNIAATANEGTEGVTDSAAASVSLIFLDLGTPSTTEFINGGGVATNAFPASTNGSACVRVTDTDQNLDSTAIESVPVTVTSSSGDSEIVTLFVTATNYGAFT